MINDDKQKLLTEIECLKKELKKNKRYGLVWEDKPEDVVEVCKTKLPVLKEVKSKEIMTDKDKSVNLLIEGDNYHALSVLNYTHAKKLTLFTLIHLIILEIKAGNIITAILKKTILLSTVNGYLLLVKDFCFQENY